MWRCKVQGQQIPLKQQLTPQNPAVLYVDDGEDSRTARKLLEICGISFFTVEGGLDEGSAPPLLQVLSWTCEGLEEIRNFLTIPAFQ